jgi:hypothetical protein
VKINVEKNIHVDRCSEFQGGSKDGGLPEIEVERIAAMKLQLRWMERDER